MCYIMLQLLLPLLLQQWLLQAAAATIKPSQPSNFKCQEHCTWRMHRRFHVSVCYTKKVIALQPTTCLPYISCNLFATPTIVAHVAWHVLHHGHTTLRLCSRETIKLCTAAVGHQLATHMLAITSRTYVQKPISCT